MNLTNESYVIYMGNNNFTERYYRDENSWLKVSARGRPLRMTAEQVLNHVLPALAVSAETGERIKPRVIFRVEHREDSKSRGGNPPPR